MLNFSASFLAVMRSIKISPDFSDNRKLSTLAGLSCPRYVLLRRRERELSANTSESKKLFPKTIFLSLVKGVENVDFFFT